jgi:hypothetical protein
MVVFLFCEKVSVGVEISHVVIIYILFYNIVTLPMEKILKELLFLNILVVLAYLQIDATMIGLYTVLALLDFMS